MRVGVSIDEEGKILSVEVIEHDEIPGIGADLINDPKVFDNLIGQDIRQAQIDVKAGVTMTSNAINDALRQAAEAYGYHDNIVYCDVKGFQPMRVGVSLDEEGKILSVEVIEHKETPGFGADLINDLKVFNNLIGQDVRQAQIDVKAGVTMTSNAINEALKAAAASI